MNSPHRKKPPRLSLTTSNETSHDDPTSPAAELALELQHNINEITGTRLFVSGKEVINNISLLTSLNINAIINCCAPRSTSHFPDFIKHLHLDIKDEPNFDITPYFGPSSSFIAENLLREGNVLIHCNAGMSRSCTLTISHLFMTGFEETRRPTLIDTFRYVKNYRIQCSPNAGFVQNLVDFERRERGQISMDIDKYKRDRFGDADQFVVEDEGEGKDCEDEDEKEEEGKR